MVTWFFMDPIEYSQVKRPQYPKLGVHNYRNYFNSIFKERIILFNININISTSCALWINADMIEIEDWLYFIWKYTSRAQQSWLWQHFRNYQHSLYLMFVTLSARWNETKYPLQFSNKFNTCTRLEKWNSNEQCNSCI